jgi:hypothetical protein
MTHHHHHLLRDVAIAGAVGLGAYELWHLHQYGNFGIGNPYNQNSGILGGLFGGPSGYGAPLGYTGGYGPYY